MTKASPGRLHRRNIRRLARAEAEKIGPAEARRKLAEWCARGGDLSKLKGHVSRSAPPLKREEIAAMVAMGAVTGSG